MKTAVLLFVCCALTASSLTEDAGESKPAATVAPAEAFDPKEPTTLPTKPTTKPTPKPTTKPTPKPTTKPTPKPTTTPAPPPPKTTTPEPPKTTTPEPPKNATTPEPPKTTTPEPPKNTTTPEPPKTTTPEPPKNTTTPEPPKTTPGPPAPTAPTNLTTGNYTLKKDNVVCLMAEMAVQIRLQTPKANGTFIVQPQQTQAQGGCKDTTANLTLAFKQGFITFLFNKSVADNEVYVNALSFSLSYPLGKGGNGVYSANNQSLRQFSAKVGHCYSCTGDSLYMGNGLYLDVNNDRMQAFNLTKSDSFGPSDRCPADQTDYRVAIGVGVTLLVLIVVVVVVYLIGRRKRADGYQSL